MLTIVLWFMYWFKWAPVSHIVKYFAAYSILRYVDWYRYWEYLPYWFTNNFTVFGTVPPRCFWKSIIKTIVTVIFG
jgi:hypothetical protein